MEILKQIQLWLAIFFGFKEEVVREIKEEKPLLHIPDYRLNPFDRRDWTEDETNAAMYLALFNLEDINVKMEYVIRGMNRTEISVEVKASRIRSINKGFPSRASHLDRTIYFWFSKLSEFEARMIFYRSMAKVSVKMGTDYQQYFSKREELDLLAAAGK